MWSGSRSLLVGASCVASMLALSSGCGGGASSGEAVGADGGVIAQTPATGSGTESVSTTEATPTLTSLAPSSVPAGSHAVTLTLIGDDFAPRSTVELNGSVVSSTYIDAQHLQILLADDLLSSGGVLRFSVVTAAPGGGTSAAVTLDVQNAVPVLDSLTPLSTAVGQGDLQLTAEGASFATNAVVMFDSSPLETVVFSTSQLAARIPAGDVMTSGQHIVTVHNPTPAGGDSAGIAFAVTDASAALSSLSPARAFAGSSDLSLTVAASGVTAGSSIEFNGTKLATTRVDSGHLQATVPAALLASSADVPVSIIGPFAGDSPSTPLVFHIDFGAPIVASFVPAVVPSGSGNTAIVITGDGFAAGATVTFDGQAATATYVNRTTLDATLPAAIAATTHDVQVIVTTPAPSGGTSTVALLPVRGESPDVITVAPSTALVGATDTTVTLTGSSFLPTSVVELDGAKLATTYLTGTSLRAVVPAADLTTPGTHALVVDNGDSGASSSVNWTVACNTSGADIVLTATGVATTVTVDWTKPAAVTPITATGAGVCPSAGGSGTAQPAAAYVVENATAASASLEAWAVCGVNNVKNDAFLAFYNRSTVPASDADRLVCSGEIAEGASGYGGLSSPEANGNKYCPGLTQANSAALTIPACGRAVVLLQAWDSTSTSYPPPGSFRLDLK